MTIGQTNLIRASSRLEFGYIGRIPVRNLWLLMLYASDLLRLKSFSKVDLENNQDEIADLVAQILVYEVDRRLKRNLSFGYQPKHAWLSRVRGHIDLLDTERNQLLNRGLVSCRFQDLTVNTPRNRLVRAALNSISGLVSDKDLARRCRIFANTLKQLGVHGSKPSRNEVSLDRFGRHDTGDQLMFAAAKLAFDLALPTEIEGTRPINAPDREATWVRHLYERAIGGFYRVVISSKGWKVDPGKSIKWPIEKATLRINEIMPSMKQDIVLDNHSENKRIVIDTKFNEIITTGWYRDESLRSSYLYQIYAYLRSQENDDDSLSKRASGLLLHPSIGDTLDETVLIQGHAIRFATVDLTASTFDIRKQLLEMIVFPAEFNDR
jgi:5-methylcytosine-specific restriction enzyme subunit McrC